MPHDDTTLDSWTWTPEPAGDGDSGLTFTVLYHPDPRRIGEVAAVSLAGPTRSVAVSRTEPVFGWADGPARPLDDAYVSRTPVSFTVRGHTVRLSLPSGSAPYAVNGVRGTGREVLTVETVRSDVVVTFGRRVLVLVEPGVRPPPRREELGLVGASAATIDLRRSLHAAGAVDTPVLLLGETGTGKEVSARAIHACSRRHRKPFVAVNLAAIPGTTAASQLFGHARGAFTGADGANPGYFGQAEGGTLFLDELGETPDTVQPLLLRAVDQHEVQPVGGPVRRTDVRLISATDADLHQLVTERRFRKALLFRMASQTIRLRPLRERPADIAVQLIWFLEQALGGAASVLAPPKAGGMPWLGMDVVQTMLAHRWTGNSRELRAAAFSIARESAEAGGGRAVVPMLEGAAQATPPPEPVGRSGLLGARRIREVLERWDYQILGAAGELGVGRNTLYAAMRERGIRVAADITPADLEAAREAVGDDTRAMARHLGVSVTNLRRRARKLEG
ncbi:MAG: DNA-binding NtrC family response regulator [Myxococcota bacterium]|jgi:DNA-binding NtrC family response regulator